MEILLQWFDAITKSITNIFNLSVNVNFSVTKCGKFCLYYLWLEVEKSCVYCCGILLSYSKSELHIFYQRNMMLCVKKHYARIFITRRLFQATIQYLLHHISISSLVPVNVVIIIIDMEIHC